jgi:beta-lactamase superfamily II metal-dependent hydrolase
VRLEFGKASFLFASDVDKRDELQLAQHPSRLTSTVVKIPRPWQRDRKFSGIHRRSDT